VQEITLHLPISTARTKDSTIQYSYVLNNITSNTQLQNVNGHYTCQIIREGYDNYKMTCQPAASILIATQLLNDNKNQHVLGDMLVQHNIRDSGYRVDGHVIIIPICCSVNEKPVISFIVIMYLECFKSNVLWKVGEG
jgi:hypothetical protein